MLPLEDVSLCLAGVCLVVALLCVCLTYLEWGVRDLSSRVDALEERYEFAPLHHRRVSERTPLLPSGRRPGLK